jgi:PII-like signaling protein
MLDIGRALRVIVHLNADVSSSHEFLHNDILAFLYERGVAGATVFRPGSEGQHLPIRLEFIDQQAVVDGLMPELLLLVTDGMVEVQETTILKVAHSADRDHR